MARVVVTTIRRHSPPSEPSGYVYTVDVDAAKVTGRCPILEPPFVHEDPNPRGGLRGAKGLAVSGDQLFLANHSAVFRFSAGWELEQTISHPSCAHIHEILTRDDTLYVTSTRNDLLIAFDAQGRIEQHWNVRAMTDLLDALDWHRENLLSPKAVLEGVTDFRDPRTHSFETYDGAHLNSLCFLPNGHMLISLGLLWTHAKAVAQRVKNRLQRVGLWEPVAGAAQLAKGARRATDATPKDAGVLNPRCKSAIVCLQPDGPRRVALEVPGTSVPIHSLLVQDDGTVLFADTNSGELVLFAPDSGAEIARMKLTNAYLRGLTRLRNGILVAGSQNELCLFDSAVRRVRKRIPLSGNPNESVFDVKELPKVFKPMPESLR